MRVLVDTSAWVDFLNGFDSSERRALRELIEGELEICTCGLVVSEVFQGLRRDAGRADVQRRFRDLTYLDSSGIDTYFHAAELYRTLRKQGVAVRSTIDCVLVAIAEEHSCWILARDRDLRLILASGLTSSRLWTEAPPLEP